MARVKAEMKCPYCGEVKAVSGMTSHVRHKHPENYKEFQENRLALVEKYKIVEGQPAPNPTPEPVPEDKGQLITMTEPAEETTPTPGEKKEEPAPEQKSGSFLGSIGKALRDW